MRFATTCAAAALALGMGATLAAQQAAVGTTPVPTGDDNKVRITGCVIKGDDGYVLSAIGEAVTVRTERTTVGTSGSTTTTTTTTTTTEAPVVAGQRYIYWLDDGDDLEDHAGRRVELIGEIEEDIDRSEIEIERENGMIELEIKANGDKVKVKLPETAANAAVGTSGGVTDEPGAIPFRVRKFDVDEVKVLASTCQ